MRASCLALGRPPVGFHSGAELRQRRPRRGGRVAVRSWDATPQGSSPLSDHIRPQASAPRRPRQGPPCVSQDALACWPRALGRGFPAGRTQNRTARRGSGFRSPGRGRCRQPVAFLAQRGAAPTPPSSDDSTPTPVRFRRLTDEMGRCLIVKRERGHFKCRLPGKTPSLCQNPQSRGTWCHRALGQTRKHTLLSEKGRCTRHTRGRE